MASRNSGKQPSRHHLPEPVVPARPVAPVMLPRPVSEGTIADWRGAPAVPPPGLSSGPDLMALLKALRRRWFLALSLGSVCAVAALAAAWFLLAPKFTAYSQLMIAANPPRMVFKTADVSDVRSDFLTYLRTQAARIKGRYVLNAALKSDEVRKLSAVNEQPDPMSWLDEELKVEFNENSEILTISMSGNEPGEVVAIVNAVTQSYLQEIDNVEHKQRSKRVAELDDIYVKAKERLRAKRETLRKRADELGTSDSQAMTQKQLIQLSSLGDSKKQHNQVRFELLQAQGRLAAHKSREKALSNAPTSELPLGDEVNKDEILKQLQARAGRIQEIIHDYESHAVSSTENTLVRAREQFQKLKISMEERQAELRTKLSEASRQKTVAEYQAARTQLEDAVTLATEQEKALGAEVDRLGKEAEKIGNTSTELGMLASEIAQDEKMAGRVSDELEALQVELRSPNRVSLHQEAALRKKDVKRQIMAMVGGPVAAFAGVAFCIAWWEFRRRRIQTTDEVVTGLGMRVVGAVPALPASSRRQASGEEADIHQHSLQESINGIRTMLLRDARVQDCRLIMVTSAVSGEGKTTLSSHLASSLAQAGRKTLLVDCDLRRPAVHQLFEMTLRPGFSEVLMGEIDLADAIRPTAIDGLSIIAAGEWNGEVLQALAREDVHDLFEKLKDQFDFVVVDSHPVLPATDALLVGQHVDAVILSLLRDVSQAPRVYAAGQRLVNLGIRVLGAVVSGIRPDHVYDKSYRHHAARTTMRA